MTIECGSQILVCDYPIRFDSYKGCSHGCSYCFTRCKASLDSPTPTTATTAVRRFLEGERGSRTSWCDWPIPLHWGGMSDPFQPVEIRHGRSLAILELLAETAYPVIVSTKGALLVSAPYLSLVAQANLVLQVSLVAPSLDRLEPGAPPFEARLDLCACLAGTGRRTVVRCQPYVPAVHREVLDALPRYAAAGVHGITVEAMKRTAPGPGLVRVGGDFVLPTAVLRPLLEEIRTHAHEVGLRFYCAENRLRFLGDDLSCCGAADLPGFTPNRANLNHHFYGDGMILRPAMGIPGTAGVFGNLTQSTRQHVALRGLSYQQVITRFPRCRTYQVVMGIRS